MAFTLHTPLDRMRVAFGDHLERSGSSWMSDCGVCCVDVWRIVDCRDQVSSPLIRVLCECQFTMNVLHAAESEGKNSHPSSLYECQVIRCRAVLRQCMYHPLAANGTPKGLRQL